MLYYIKIFWEEFILSFFYNLGEFTGNLIVQMISSIFED